MLGLRGRTLPDYIDRTDDWWESPCALNYVRWIMRKKLTVMGLAFASRKVMESDTEPLRDLRGKRSMVYALHRVSDPGGAIHAVRILLNAIRREIVIRRIGAHHITGSMTAVLKGM